MNETFRLESKTTYTKKKLQRHKISKVFSPPLSVSLSLSLSGVMGVDTWIIHDEKQNFPFVAKILKFCFSAQNCYYENQCKIRVILSVENILYLTKIVVKMRR